MKDLGEIKPNSTIYLEIITIDKQNKPLPLDNPPLAFFEFHEQNSPKTLTSVKLESKDNGRKYARSFKIPSSWKSGKYNIRYILSMNHNTHDISECFTLISPSLFSVQSTESLTDSGETPNNIDDFLLSSDFQLPSQLSVSNNVITITPNSTLKKNCNYTIVLDGAIRSINGVPLGKKEIITFSTEYAPLYATPIELRSILKDLFSQFMMEELYIALRNASQKVHVLLGTSPDANNVSFRPLTSMDSNYFPATKFTIYEAADQLLSKLLIKQLNASDQYLNSSTSINNGSIKLGDFSVSNNQSTSSGSSSQDPIISMVNAISSKVQEQLSFWTDALFGRHTRKYAKPVTAVMRSDTPAPNSRDI